LDSLKNREKKRVIAEANRTALPGAVTANGAARGRLGHRFNAAARNTARTAGKEQ
jgi:hypothetical protein